MDNGLANCLRRTRHDTHEAVLSMVSQSALRCQVAMKAYQLTIGSIRREVLALISLENVVGAHLVSLCRCLVAKSMSTERRTRNNILSRMLSVSPALLSLI